jgi:AcrR family transcriptional regulator
MARASLAAPSARRSQQERRDDMQRKLLDATLECLIALGYARITTTEIVRVAGVSQGALFKYYPTKADLLSAAVEHLFAELVHGYEQAFAQLAPSAASAEQGFELLWAIFTGPRLAIAFELYLAARTDAELAQALEPVVIHHRKTLVRLARQLFPAAAARTPEFDGWVDLVMCAMEGLVIERYGAGNVGGPALAVLKQLVVSMLQGARAAGPASARRATRASKARRR